MRKLLLALVVVCAPLLTGCLGMTPMPMSQYTNDKGLDNEHVTRTLDPVNAEYKILGAVEATGNSRVICGFVFAEGSEGYGLLMRNARDQYDPDTTTILFPMMDYEYSGILYPIWGTMKTNYYGTAVKATDIEQMGADVAVDEDVYPDSGGLLGGLLPF
ncbi:hypothetical protein KQI84_08415 [bacterium]|nr:hypothetical protein [bacterium]